MLVIFFAVTGFVLLVRRPLWEKLFIAASAPIALIVNVIRITSTGILYQVGSSETAHAVFHDLAGWLMMPMALGLLAVELWLLKNLLLDPEPEGGPAPVAYAIRSRPAAAPVAPPTATAALPPVATRRHRPRAPRPPGVAPGPAADSAAARPEGLKPPRFSDVRRSPPQPGAGWTEFLSLRRPHRRLAARSIRVTAPICHCMPGTGLGR
jgi:exosortase/archaeosortase family protein